MEQDRGSRGGGVAEGVGSVRGGGDVDGWSTGAGACSRGKGCSKKVVGMEGWNGGFESDLRNGHRRGWISSVSKLEVLFAIDMGLKLIGLQHACCDDDECRVLPLGPWWYLAWKLSSRRPVV